jgi:aldose 1-epimerase
VIELALQGQRALVAETGAALRTYVVGDRPVVEPSARGYSGTVLAPWPNRVVDGRWTWRGRTHQLDVNEPARGHALHGLVHALDWRVDESGPAYVVLEVDLEPQPGWPFPMRFTASYELRPTGLLSRITAENVGDEPCPYGVGTHPYMALRGADVDDVVVHMDADTYLAVDDRLAPLEKRAVRGTSRPVDNAFTDLRRPAEAHVANPDGFTTTLWGDETVCWWQLFVEDVIALEPMTCAPDALNSGDGLLVLEPGGTHAMTWGLRLQPSTRSR